MVKSSNYCLVQTFSLPNILSSFFSHVVALTFLFGVWQRQVFGWPIFTAWFLVGCLPTCSWDFALCLAATTIFVEIKFIPFCAQIDFFGLRASTLWKPESWYVLYHDGRLQDAFSKNISFDDPQNRGHFSCRKPVSHVGTSTVWCMMHSPHLKRPAVQSFRSNSNKLLSSLYLHVPSLLCCGKESLTRLSRFRLFWVFVLLADANTADRTLCKYL